MEKVRYRDSNPACLAWSAVQRPTRLTEQNPILLYSHLSVKRVLLYQRGRSPVGHQRAHRDGMQMRRGRHNTTIRHRRHSDADIPRNPSAAARPAISEFVRIEPVKPDCKPSSNQTQPVVRSKSMSRGRLFAVAQLSGGRTVDRILTTQ